LTSQTTNIHDDHVNQSFDTKIRNGADSLMVIKDPVPVGQTMSKMRPKHMLEGFSNHNGMILSGEKRKKSNRNAECISPQNQEVRKDKAYTVTLS